MEIKTPLIDKQFYYNTYFLFSSISFSNLPSASISTSSIAFSAERLVSIAFTNFFHISSSNCKRYSITSSFVVTLSKLGSSI
nr:MAG TPA: hypothetical protein [Caudoviricetes sp.]